MEIIKPSQISDKENSFAPSQKDTTGTPNLPNRKIELKSKDNIEFNVTIGQTKEVL